MSLGIQCNACDAAAPAAVTVVAGKYTCTRCFNASSLSRTQTALDLQQETYEVCRKQIFFDVLNELAEEESLRSIAEVLKKAYARRYEKAKDYCCAKCMCAWSQHTEPKQCPDCGNMYEPQTAAKMGAQESATRRVRGDVTGP